MLKPGYIDTSAASPRSLTRPGANRTALTATASVASPLVVTYFFHSDHLGTPKVKTGPTGAVVETWDSYPYGEQWVAGSPGDQHRFTGHLRDSESGNDYAGARYYSNNRGRWLATDPELGDLTNPQRLNRYAYVLNDPINYVDPDGRQECQALVCVQVVGAFPSIGSSRWVFGERTRAVPVALVQETPGSRVGQRSLSLDYMRALIRNNNLSGLSDELILCQAYRESAFMWQAESQAGAKGLLQITLKAAIDAWSGHPNYADQGVPVEVIEGWFEEGGKIFDPAFNIATGTAYLGWLLSDWPSVDGDIAKALDKYSKNAEGYSKKILECEKGLKDLPPGGDPMDVLERVHGKD